MIRSWVFTRSSAAFALAAAIAVGGMVAAPVAIAKDKPAPAANANSKEFATAAKDLQATLAAAQPAIQAFTSASGAARDAALAALRSQITAAPAQLATAEAAIKTPGDRLLAGKWGVMVGSITGDTKLQQHGYVQQLESGATPAAELASLKFKLGSIAYINKDYATAIANLTPIVTEGYSDESAAELLADSYAKSGQAKQGLTALMAAMDARKKAGQPIPAAWADRGVSIAFENKLNTESVEWAALRLGVNPTQFNWISAVQITREVENYGDAEGIDLSRLLLKVGVLDVKSPQVEREYVEYIQAAVGKVGVLYPGETLKIAQKGVALTVLQSSDPFVSGAINEAKARLAADRASLPALEKEARLPASSARTALKAADVFLSYEMYAQAEALYALALTKPGVETPLAKLRLGMAQLGQGKTAEAQANFAAVEGKLAPIARLWLAYAGGATLKL
jgi:hypothetical protein